MKHLKKLLVVLLVLTFLFSLVLSMPVIAAKPDNPGKSDSSEKSDKSDNSDKSDKSDKSNDSKTDKDTGSEEKPAVTDTDKQERKAEQASDEKQLKEKEKKQIRESYTETELDALEEAATEINAKHKDIKAFPVENLIIRGKNVKFDTPPVIKDGRMLVPVRALSQAFGAEVGYDPATRQVTVTKDGKTIVINLDSKTALVNGVEVQLEVPAQSLNSRTVVPLRFITEQLGLKIDYDSTDGTVVIDDGTSGDTTGTNTTPTPEPTATPSPTPTPAPTDTTAPTPSPTPADSTPTPTPTPADTTTNP